MEVQITDSAADVRTAQVTGASTNDRLTPEQLGFALPSVVRDAKATDERGRPVQVVVTPAGVDLLGVSPAQILTLVAVGGEAPSGPDPAPIVRVHQTWREPFPGATKVHVAVTAPNGVAVTATEIGLGRIFEADGRDSHGAPVPVVVRPPWPANLFGQRIEVPPHPLPVDLIITGDRR